MKSNNSVPLSSNMAFPLENDLGFLENCWGMNKNASWIGISADDWTTERAIIASNEMQINANKTLQ